MSATATKGTESEARLSLNSESHRHGIREINSLQFQKGVASASRLSVHQTLGRASMEQISFQKPSGCQVPQGMDLGETPTGPRHLIAS